MLVFALLTCFVLAEENERCEDDVLERIERLRNLEDELWVNGILE